MTILILQFSELSKEEMADTSKLEQLAYVLADLAAEYGLMDVYHEFEHKAATQRSSRD